MANSIIYETGGQIGISTTNPLNKLQVTGGGITVTGAGGPPVSTEALTLNFDTSDNTSKIYSINNNVAWRNMILFSANFVIRTNDINRLTVSDTGSVSVADASSLFFGSTVRQMINLYNTDYGIGVQNSTQYFRSGGRFSWFRGGSHSDTENNAGGGGVVAMTLDSSSNLNVTGDVVAFSSSDKRLKDNLTRIENPLKKLEKLGGYSFDWNDKQDTYEGHDYGVIAQEIEEIMPEIVTTRDNGYKAVKYEKLIPLLIESIKELNKDIVKLTNEIDILKNNK